MLERVPLVPQRVAERQQIVGFVTVLLPLLPADVGLRADVGNFRALHRHVRERTHFGLEHVNDSVCRGDAATASLLIRQLLDNLRTLLCFRRENEHHTAWWWAISTAVWFVRVGCTGRRLTTAQPPRSCPVVVPIVPTTIVVAVVVERLASPAPSSCRRELQFQLTRSPPIVVPGERVDAFVTAEYARCFGRHAGLQRR